MQTLFIECDMEEIWKAYNRYYEISNRGRVRNSETAHILAQNVNSGGYWYATLSRPTKYNLTVHRGMAILFIPNPLNKTQVNHINGNKLDNSIENLEWASQEENLKHAVDNKLMPQGTSSYLAKLDEEKVEAIRISLSKGIMQAALARQYGVDRGTISGIKLGRTWKHVRPDLYK